MNSWECGLPSAEMHELFRQEEDARTRVQKAKKSLAAASQSTRNFWRYILSDRMAVLNGIENEIVKKKTHLEENAPALDPMEIYLRGRRP